MLLNILRAPNKIIRAGMQLPHGPTSAPCCRQLSLEPTVSQMVSQLRSQLKETRIYLQERYFMWKLRYLLGPDFSKEEFLEGTYQATAAMLEAVRRVDWRSIRNFCTEEFALSMYIIAQRESVYANLMRLQADDVEVSQPVTFRRKKGHNGRSFVYVELGIVGMRFVRVKPDELMEISGLPLTVPSHQQILLATFKIAFRKELSGTDGSCPKDEAWLFNSFRLRDMSLMGFCPQSGECWFIRPVKPY
ncbi:uncharacterized protein LOC117592641 [Drosophila guanche]|uniref:Uncharacterized protein n=1 Tax=Drosophila guanche TaxID=7266 RepID=A0A3B0JJD7_DROGU|nr:uncharacterized protein LOC117592641 [Drosophila guanche]SPP73559.1 Hypothetical predicted protein [Drosophila guanche]